MNLLESFKGLFKGKANRLDVSSRFRFERHAYTGTMSKFRVARDIKTGELVGIKFLDKEKTELFRARFKGLKKPEEGEIGLQLNNERVVTTYEYGKTTTGIEYILMEYIDGPGLHTLINEKSARLRGVELKFIRQMAEAIRAVHNAGFIHRDVCPRNFICNREVEWLKLIDFGLTVPNTAEFRQPGNRTGTPQYMAPEIVRRRETDQRVDIFAFGISAYRLLTFEHPWGSTETSGIAALAHDTRHYTPITQHRSDIHPILAKAIHRCIEPQLDERMPSIEHFLRLIRNVDTPYVESTSH